MGRVIHFEIHAENPERAIAFYTKTFGWQFSKWEGPIPYWLITTGPDSEPGINGGLVKRHGPIDGQAIIAYVGTVQVASVDEASAKIQANGGSIVEPKFPVPTIGWLAYCKDSEGNIFNLMQPDPAAA